MIRRSPRAGWALIELRDGRWHTAAVGDREAMRALFERRVSDLLQLPAVSVTLPGPDALRQIADAAAGDPWGRAVHMLVSTDPEDAPADCLRPPSREVA